MEYDRICVFLFPFLNIETQEKVKWKTAVDDRYPSDPSLWDRPTLNILKSAFNLTK